ncbi:hypothetical protein [Streptomyces bobili]|uniref:Uncharacterized protein n=1 Tax=Streptomyces bobili TaxID=67280 RepID=A0ABZ1QQY1_9ACTN|nr:hypothetical protein [Streptomyces bobili]
MLTLESFDFAEPAVVTGFADAFAEVPDDLDEAGSVAGVDLEDRRADAGFSELTRVSRDQVRGRSDLTGRAGMELENGCERWGC